MFFNKPVSTARPGPGRAARRAATGAVGVQPVSRPGVRPRAPRTRCSGDGQSHYITQAQADAADAEPLEVQHNDSLERTDSRTSSTTSGGAAPAFAGVERLPGRRQRRAEGVHDDRSAQAASWRVRRFSATRAAGPNRPPRSSRSTRTTATSSRWRPRRHTTRRTSTTQPRPTGRPGSAFKVFMLMTLIHDYNGDPSQTYYNSHFLARRMAPGYPAYRCTRPSRPTRANRRHQRDDRLGQHRVRSARRRPRARTRSTRPRTRWGSPRSSTRLPSEAIGGLRIGVSPLRDGRRVRDAGQQRLPHSRHGDHSGRVPRRQRRKPRRPTAHAGVLRRRDVRRDGGAQAGDHRAAPGRPPATAAPRPARPAPRTA